MSDEKRYQGYNGIYSLVLLSLHFLYLYKAPNQFCRCIYLKEHDASFREFLTLNRDGIINPPSDAEEWYGLQTTWSIRYLRAVKDLIPDRHKVLKNNVMFIYLFQKKSKLQKGDPGQPFVMLIRGVQWSIGPSDSDCLLASRRVDLGASLRPAS